MSYRRALTRTIAAVAGLAAVGVTLAVAPAADAAFPGYGYFIRPADFVQPTGTRGGATLQVQSDGAHIHTSVPTDLAAATFDIPGGLPLYDFNVYGYQVTYSWTGSTDEPGVHYDIDLDGDGQADLELVGEHKYGDDMWLNTGFYRADPTVPQSAIRGAAPCVGDRVRSAPMNGCASTYGDRFHGTILDWRSGFADQGYADGSVVRGGFVATGGYVDGVLASMSIGIDSFRFTTDPRVPADLTISVSPKSTTRGHAVTVSGTAGNTYNYPYVVLQQKAPGAAWQDVDSKTLTTGDHYSFDRVAGRPGVTRYRVVVPRSSYNTRTVSDEVAVRVTAG